MKKEVFSAKIKIGEVGTFTGVAMSTGIPEGRPYFNFTKESVSAQTGTEAKLMMDHAQSQSLMVVGSAKFTSFNGKDLIFEAGLLMEAKDVAENIYPRVKAGLVDSVSVGVVFDEYREDPKDPNVLIIDKFHIDELSIVPFPAFKKAKIKNAFSAEDKEALKTAMFSLFAIVGAEPKNESISFDELNRLTVNDFENILKQVGFSNSLSEKIANLVKPLLRENGQGDLGNQYSKEELVEFLKTKIKR